MAHGKHKPQQQEEEGGEGAPLWIISFADMMSLLMAFFVMLSTFSGFGPTEAEKLQKTVRATLAPNYGGWHGQPARMAAGKQTPAAGQGAKGSEKPTLAGGGPSGLMKETPSGDFRTRKIFLIESNKVFWGSGMALSAGGRDFLDTLAAYAAKMPDRLVISESGPAVQKTEDGGPSSDVGLLRASAVLNYLTGKGIRQDRCSIAAGGMSPDRSFESQRMLEIALLGASVYQ